MKIAKKDYKFVPIDPESGFSPERNKQVVENSIRKYEAIRRKKFQQFRDNLSERTEALAWYITSRKAQSGFPAESYFSRRMMAYLRGDQLRNEMMTDKVLKADTTRLHQSITKKTI